jgi:hypothetical protein
VYDGAIIFRVMPIELRTIPIIDTYIHGICYEVKNIIKKSKLLIIIYRN